MVYLHGTAESKLNKETLAKMINEDFGYELVSFKEDRAGDWAGLKKKYGIK